jgi:hypothetical protein
MSSLLRERVEAKFKAARGSDSSDGGWSDDD